MADGARVTARAARSAAGLLLAAAAVLWLLSQVSGIVIPLVLAAVLGALFAPVVERLRGVGLPRSVGAALEGLPGVLGGVLGGAASFLIGLVIAVFLLYYVLVDWDGLRRWVGAHLGLAPDVGASAVDDAVDSVRRYFWSLTLSAVVTAVLIGGTPGRSGCRWRSRSPSSR